MKTVLVALLLAAGMLCPCAHAQQSDKVREDQTEAVHGNATVNSTAVDMVRENGVLKVPVQINGAISLKFVVDSGAAEVLIPKDVFLTLIRTETIKEKDFLPGKTFVLADGSKVKSDRFILRSIKVGESTFSDVEASIGGLDATLLLGQSFLSRFEEWKIDNKNGKLLLTVVAEPQVKPAFNPLKSPSPSKPEAKLFLKRIIKVPFRLLFQAYDGDPAKPQKMIFQIIALDRGRKTDFLKIGEKVSNSFYRLEKFEFKEVVNQSTRGKQDVSELTVVNLETGDAVVLVKERETDSPNVFALFDYQITGRDIQVKKLQEFILLPDKDKRYKLLDVNDSEALIQLPNGDKYTVPRSSQK